MAARVMPLPSAPAGLARVAPASSVRYVALLPRGNAFSEERHAKGPLPADGADIERAAPKLLVDLAQRRRCVACALAARMAAQSRRAEGGHTGEHRGAPPEEPERIREHVDQRLAPDGSPGGVVPAVSARALRHALIGFDRNR